MKLWTTNRFLSKIKSFKNVDKKNRSHSYKSPVYILAWVGFTIGILAFISCIIQYTVIIRNNNDFSIFNSQYAIWFDCFGYFTQMSNIAVLIYYILFFTAFKTKIFNTRNFPTIIATAITVTMTVYTMGILPSSIAGHDFNTYWLSILESICFHGICPIILLVHYFLGVNYPNKISQKNVLNRIFGINNILWILLIILIYWSYTIIINFISMPEIFRSDIQQDPDMIGHFYYSVYGMMTNYNVNCYNTNLLSEKITIGSQYGHGNILVLLNIFAILTIAYVIYAIICFGNNALASEKSLKLNLKKMKKDFINQRAQEISKFLKDN